MDCWRKILVSYRKCVGAVQPGKSTSVSRRGICDRTIWRKPLAFAADAEGYKYIVWVFNARFAILSPESRQLPSFVERKVLAQQDVTTPRRKNPDSAKTAAPPARGSVRCASGFVQISIALIYRQSNPFPIAQSDLTRHHARILHIDVGIDFPLALA